MRWDNIAPQVKPYKKCFAWFPVTVDFLTGETVWLEHVEFTVKYLSGSKSLAYKDFRKIEAES